MSNNRSKNTIQESSSNLFFLILTLSMLSFFAFGNNRLGAFFITFLISLLSLSILLYYVFKKEKANFELRKKDNIDKLLDLIKEPEKIANTINVQEHIIVMDSFAGDTAHKDLKLIEIKLKDSQSSQSLNVKERMKSHNYRFLKSMYVSPYYIDVPARMGIDLLDSSLPSVLNQFGEILENDNDIQHHPYTDNDVNGLIMKMDICMKNIQGRYIHNQYSKEITVIILQSAIDYLKEKNNIPVYGNSDPFLPLYK